MEGSDAAGSARGTREGGGADQLHAVDPGSDIGSTPPSTSRSHTPHRAPQPRSPLGSTLLSPSAATTSTSPTIVTTASSAAALSRRSTPASPPLHPTSPATHPTAPGLTPGTPPRTPSPFPMTPSRPSVSTSTSSVSVSTKLDSPRRSAGFPGREMERGASGSGSGSGLKGIGISGVGTASGGLSKGTRAPAESDEHEHDHEHEDASASKRSSLLSSVNAGSERSTSPYPAVLSSTMLANTSVDSTLHASTSTTASRASPSPTPGRARSRRGKERDKDKKEDKDWDRDSTPPLSRSHSRTHSRSHSHSFGHAHSHSMDTSVPEAEIEDVAALGVVAASGADVRRELRELVAARGSSMPSRLARTPSARARHPVFNKRRYYVLTNAGKPVFSVGHDDEDTLTNMMGVAQALISIFAQDDDRPRTILRGRTRTTFVLKPPLYLFAVSDWGEPDYVLRMHLEYINLQILSVVSAVQLSRAFQRRSNFDLSRLLEGSEPYLNKLVTQCQDDLSFLTTTLQPLRMAPALRDTAAAALTPPAKFKDLLYVLLIAGGRIVTLLRPRRHTVHPSDMHLLLNTLATSATLRTVETWLPICLPKFNPAGFVHAYISFVRDDVGLVFISADRDAFEPLCGWRAAVVDTLKKDGALDKIEASIKAHPYSVAAVGSPGLRHFVYKSRGIVQLTAPEWEEPYGPDSDDRKRLVTLYQKVQDALFARSGQPTPLKLVYMANGHEAVLGWLTKPFELYIAVSPHLPMNAVVGTANKVAKWVNAEESRLFLKDAPVF